MIGGLDLFFFFDGTCLGAEEEELRAVEVVETGYCWDALKMKGVEVDRLGMDDVNEKGTALGFKDKLRELETKGASERHETVDTEVVVTEDVAVVLGADLVLLDGGLGLIGRAEKGRVREEGDVEGISWIKGDESQISTTSPSSSESSKAVISAAVLLRGTLVVEFCAGW